MIRFLFVGAICLGCQIPTRAQTTNRCEGPFISYRNGKAIVRSINDSGKLVLYRFYESEKQNKTVSVPFSHHEDWNFSVPLKSQILPEPSTWPAADSIVAFSDIEGEFEPFRDLLISNKVMDSTYRWTFGKGHLVICGDLFDRGREVVALLWLLYKLEAEAVAAGGYVHTILGNHDIMNLSGDFRYVDKKYFGNAKIMGVRYADLFNKSSELGRWLRSKNITEIIGHNLFVHGGISSEILDRKMSVAGINNVYRPYYDKGLNPEFFPEKSYVEVFDNDNSSPFWYRGYFRNPKASQALVDSTLAFYNVNKIIVGHNILENVGCFYQGKVIGIDVNEHAGNYQGLLMVNNRSYKIDLTGIKQELPCK